MKLLENFIDMHIHSSPDVRRRKMDDIEIARSANAAGMAGVVLKSHVTLTADRARIAESLVPDIRVFGSLALNEQVGGVNPSAVKAAIDMGAKVIWLPTISSTNHKTFYGEMGGISLVDESGKISTELIEVFHLLKKAKTVLATGHISVKEILHIIPIAKNEGVEKIIITHPEVPWINMTVRTQKKLLAYDVMFERCFVSTMEIGGGVPFNRITNAIQEVGIDTTILSTDFGAEQLPTPVEGFLDFISALKKAGFSDGQIRIMGSTNPAQILDIE